ncbi:MAG: COX15/CtaA family protein [Elusimicrobiota bacterium]|nr:COX15/CtaA family protein [Elusimicrobiota bacterium]
MGPLNAAAVLLLLAAGGMVTSTASGLAVPDWPLSYGKWMPEMTGGVFYEHGHRMLASGVGFLILLMAFLTQWEEARPGVRRLAWWTLGLTVVQGLLGGITVYYGLPVQTSAAHAVIGQTVFCLVVVMADLVGREEAPAGSPPAAGLLAAVSAAVASLWLQLVLGAVLRHGGAGLRWHLLGAVPAALAALWAACAVLHERREAALRGPAWALAALIGAQLLLGSATAAFRLVPSPRTSHPMIATATIHLVTGALLLGTAVLLAARTWRLRSSRP